MVALLETDTELGTKPSAHQRAVTPAGYDLKTTDFNIEGSLIYRFAMDLKGAIEEHKWLRSEEENRDIGWETARFEFYRSHYRAFHAAWRSEHDLPDN